MNQKVCGYHKDFEDHWVAELECGHGQHVRHDPPWQERVWVTTPEGRAGRLGTELNCVRCDEMGLRVAKATIEECKKTLIAGYSDAGVAGLCDEGRWEAALGTLQQIDPKKISDRSLKI